MLWDGGTVSPNMPVWSPDGARLAVILDKHESFCSQFGPECVDVLVSELWTINQDGTGPAIVPNRGARCPAAPYDYCAEVAAAWSASNGIVVATSRSECIDDGDDPPYCLDPDQQLRLFTVNPDGSDAQFIGGAEEPPDWSPDGERLVTGGPRVETMNADGTARVTIHADVGGETVWSPDGTRIAFRSLPGWKTISPEGSGVAPMSGPLAGAVYGAAWQPLRALDPYPRPSGGTPYRVPLVPAYDQCTTASQNANHVAPLALDSCAPPTQSSPVLTTSSIGRGTAHARLDVDQGLASTPEDEADVRIYVRAGDVVCRATNAACPSGAGSEFTGSLLFDARFRLTDRNSGFGGVSATTQDSDLQVPLSCAGTPSSPHGSTCTAVTSADTLIPGYVTEGKRSVFSFLDVTLRDPGPNRSGYGSGCPPACGDGDESVYMHQGVFNGL
jgi:hypothetical protein